MPTKQETFNTVCKHLLEQNACAMDSYSNVCMYKTRDGLKCAVGCLIPEDKYTEEFENTALAIGNEISNLMEELGHNISLLVDLQYIHDNYSTIYWKSALAKAAKQWNLSFDENL